MMWSKAFHEGRKTMMLGKALYEAFKHSKDEHLRDGELEDFEELDPHVDYCAECGEEAEMEGPCGTPLCKDCFEEGLQG